MKRILIILAIVALGIFIGTQDEIKTRLDAFNFTNTWQALSSPGDLSKAHQSLEKDCESCHLPVSGVDDKQCIMCHANDTAILIQQPTAFHADIQECSTCHQEHLGRDATLTRMDHDLLAVLARSFPDKITSSTASEYLVANTLKELEQHVKIHPSNNPLLSEQESLLDCASCHANDDRHFKLFGTDCADCHGTSQWPISGYRHPSPRSTDCSQCHQAPPSHYKPHYKMMSQKIAGKPNAAVEQCYQCHQKTSWSDIKQLGLYKHH